MTGLTSLHANDKDIVRMGLQLLLAVHPELDRSSAPATADIERLLAQVETAPAGASNSATGGGEGPGIVNSIKGGRIDGQVTQVAGNVHRIDW